MTKSRRPFRRPVWALLLLTLAGVLLLPSAADADGTDGSGSIAVAPSVVLAGSTGNSLTFTYTADSVGVAGGAVEVDVPDGWTAPQTSTPGGPGYVTASAGTLGVSAGGDGTGGTIDVSLLTLAPGQALTITYSKATAPTTGGSNTFTTSEQETALGTLTRLTSGQPTVQVAAEDGSGTMVPAPQSVFAGSSQAYTFTYTAADGGIQNGTVDMTIPSGWTPPQIGDLTAPGYVSSSLAQSDNALLDQAGSVSIQPGDVVQVTGVSLAAGDTLLVGYDDVTAPAAGTYTFTTDEGSLGGDTPAAIATQPEVGVTPVQTPGAPTLNPVDPGNGQVQLSWSPPAEDGGGSITGYVIDEYAGGGTSSTATVIETGSTATTATVPNLTNGQEYTFTVQGVNSAGNGTPSGAESTTPYTVPDAPTLASPTPEDGGVELSWSAPSDNGSALIGYQVDVYSGSDTSTLVTAIDTGTTTTSATVPNLTNGDDYTFTVVAINGAGDGPASNPEHAIPAAAPAAPALTSAAGGDQQVQLSWSAPGDDGGAAVNDYLIDVYSGSGTSDKLTTIDTGSTTTSATVPNLQNGEEYTFTVQAVNTAGDGPASGSQSATPYGIPGSPTLGAPSAGNGQVQLSWSPPLDSGGAVSDYLIDVYSGSGTSGSPMVIDTGSTATSATVPNLVNGQQYTFTVVAHNPAGDGAASNAESQVPSRAPDAPSLTADVPGNQRVQLTWSAPAEDGGSAVDDYLIDVYAGSGTGSTETVVDTKSTNTSFSVSNLVNGQEYTFTVVAHNAAGDGAVSNSESATPATSPSAPSLSPASPGDQQVRLSWSAPSQTGGANLDDYLINVYSGSTDTGTPMEVIDTHSTSLSATVPGLTNDQKYTFTIEAANTAGDSTASNPESATPTTAPGVPSLTSVTPGDQQVQVSWMPPSSGTEPTVTGYLIDVYTGSGMSGTPRVIDASSTLTSATVHSLTNGQAYTFTVQAANGAADSAASNSESATPATTPDAPSLTSVSPGSQQAQLSWSAPADDGGADVSDYLIDVYSGSGTAGPPKVIDTGSKATAATVPGLSNGQPYTFTVRAVNWAGDGAASAGESVTPASAPASPHLMATSAGDGIVEIIWSPTPAADDGGAPVTGYDVFRSITAGQRGTQIANVYSGESYIDQSVTNKTTYYYEVAAVNQAGPGTPSNQLSATPKAFVAPPTLVKTITIRGHQVTLSSPNQCIKAGKVQGKLTVSSHSSDANKLTIGRSVFTVGTLAKKTIRRSRPSRSPVKVTMYVKHMAPGGSYPFTATPSIKVGTGRAHTYRLRLEITAC